MTMLVNVDNFARAETDRMFAAARRRTWASTVRASPGTGVGRRATGHPPEPRHALQQRDRRHLRRSNTVDSRRRRPIPVGDGRQQRPLHQRGTAHSRRASADRRAIRHRLRARRRSNPRRPERPCTTPSRPRTPRPVALDAESARPFVMPDYDTASFDAHARSAPDPRRGASRLRPRLRRARTPSTRSTTCSGPRRAGAACPSRRRSTSTSTLAPRRRVQGHGRATFPSTASGRSRSTTPPATSSPTTATPTA